MIHTSSLQSLHILYTDTELWSHSPTKHIQQHLELWSSHSWPPISGLLSVNVSVTYFHMPVTQIDTVSLISVSPVQKKQSFKRRGSSGGLLRKGAPTAHAFPLRALSVFFSREQRVALTWTRRHF